MKHTSRYNAMAINGCLDSYGIMDPSGRDRIFPCKSCGRDTKLYQARVLYCFMCGHGNLHPRYNFALDKLI